jgi:cytosolic 5'-nucleotidase 3
MPENIITSNKEKLEKIKKTIAQGGADKLHILSDFDRTLTNAFVNGKSVPSLISILRDGNYLTPDYALKANQLYDKYHQIEIDPEISLGEKKKAMEEWWRAHFNLLIESGLNKEDLEKIARTEKIRLRSGFSEFADFLHLRGIPLIIISSSGLGSDNIAMYLEKEGKLYDNVHIVSNSYEWDESGKAIRVNEPIIHTMNKDETSVQDYPFFKEIKNRKNVLLLGDSLGDVGMVKGFDYDNLLKVGFLNEKIEERLKDYSLNYDLIILNDSSMDYLNQLLKEIIG